MNLDIQTSRFVIIQTPRGFELFQLDQPLIPRGPGSILVLQKISGFPDLRPHKDYSKANRTPVRLAMQRWW